MQQPQYSLAPGCTMCILRGCSASDWFVTVIGDQMALRRTVFASSVLSLAAITVVLWELNSLCNIYSRVQPCPADEYILLSNNFSLLNGVAFVACGKLEGHNDGLLHTLGTMYRWCVAAFSSGLWNIFTSVDQVLDGRLYRRTSRSTHCARSRGRPSSIKGRNPGTCCTCCVTKDHWEPSACSRTQYHVCFWPGYHLDQDTAKHGYSAIVKESTGE